MSIRFRSSGLLSFSRSASTVLILALFVLSGCGVGSKQRVDVETAPVGAFVYVNGKFVGNSPLDVKLNRQVPHKVELKKVGFISQDVMVYPSVPEGGEPSIVFGPLRESGYYRDLDPNPVSVELVYGPLERFGETLSPVEAERLVQRIQQERQEDLLTDSEAALALSQVQSRME